MAGDLDNIEYTSRILDDLKVIVSDLEEVLHRRLDDEKRTASDDEARASMEPATQGVLRIARERHRQIHEEGFDASHDDRNTEGELAMAAAHYALRPALSGLLYLWPCTWAKQWNKKCKYDRIRQLEIAGALIAAEIDRLLRADNIRSAHKRDEESAH